jgi:hypothetical protein
MAEETPRVEPLISFWHIASGRELFQIPAGSGAGNLVFSPDGRLLAASGAGGAVCLREVASGQERRLYSGHEAGTYWLDFSQDGRRIASAGGQDCTALIWQVFGPGPADQTEAALAAQWDDLAGNATTAHRAIGALIGAKGAVPFLAQRLSPAAAVAAERLTQLIADLDSPRFATRAEAEKELARLADLAATALQQALANNPTLEARQRIERLLQGIDEPITNAEMLRQLRAVEALEYIGTADARQLLQRLAEGAPDARLTRDAKASLERLRRTK